MKASYSSYNHVASCTRIREILGSSDNNYEEKDSIPSRDSLTFTNGFYVNCSAMFVDIRGSKELTEKYYRPGLARIYRSYISELVAVMRDHSRVAEINIEGDCVWGVFDTPKVSHVNELFSVAAKTSSMIDILNWRFDISGYDQLSVGIGLDYGRALMLKAGYSGSGINNVVWMGDVVNRASELCSYGSRDLFDDRLMVSSTFRGILNEHNQGLLTWHGNRSCYHGNVINLEMDKWLKEQKS